MPTIPCSRARSHTDVSYLACMRLLLADPAAFFPQFATHNAHIDRRRRACRGGRAPFEFQRLHGMGEALYEEVVGERQARACACRIYAPVGPHEDLVAYLVRRLLENGANTSFVNRLADEEAPIDGDRARPRARAVASGAAARAVRLLPRPPDIFLPERAQQPRHGARPSRRCAQPLAARDRGASWRRRSRPRPSSTARSWHGGERGRAGAVPARPRAQRIGTVRTADAGDDRGGASRARAAAAHAWDRLGGPARAAILDEAADLYERDRVRLMAVMVREAGKTLDNALGDVREAVDFLRYYAAEARRLFAGAGRAQGPDGRDQHAGAAGRAVRSPASRPGTSRWRSSPARWRRRWRPAIRCSPSPPSRRRSSRSWPSQLLHEAGVPPDVLHLLPGAGAVGAALVKDPRVAGVAFTGSNDDRLGHPAARWPTRRGAMVPFIAETGGLNAMIADFERAARAGDPRRGALGLRTRRASAARRRACSSCRRTWPSR